MKRKFVTAHQLQQEQQKQKKKNKVNQNLPELPKRILTPRKCNMPAVETLEPEQAVVNSKGTARRKLSLPDDKRNGKSNKVGNEIAAEVPS